MNNEYSKGMPHQRHAGLSAGTSGQYAAYEGNVLGRERLILRFSDDVI